MSRRRFDALVAMVLVLASVLAWGCARNSAPPAAWPERVGGFAYSPFRAGQDPATVPGPGEAELGADLDLLASRARAVRLYSLEGPLARIPALAAARGMSVTAGVSLGPGPAGSEESLERFLAAMDAERHVQRAIIGNESVLRGDLRVGQLSELLDRARERLDVPVSTAEPWHVWLRHPELARHVDFITVHLLPYWEGVAAAHAADFVDARMAELHAAFPGKPVVIGEMGWPSHGRTRGDARASPAIQARVLSRFLARAEAAGYDYFIMEAFDQPWKRRDEGAVGAYWGVFDVHRGAKRAVDGAPVQGWNGILAGGAAGALAAMLFALALRGAGRLRRPGRVLLAGTAWTIAAVVVWVVEAHLGRYWQVVDLPGVLLVTVGLLGAAALLMTESHEWAEARWGDAPPQVPAAGMDLPLPLVSIHLPVCNEPPDMVVSTLHALAALDYPRLEVVVVDNNTPQERTWRPVRDACQALGERFRFHHVPVLPGFKAGALNVALKHTDEEATVVAVIDADYEVSQRWLSDLVPLFADPAVHIVQAPQDYRDADRSLFKTACYQEYRGFFHLGMMVRARRNAIIQHGTMTLVRRDALEAAGGWGEWCITEDAELGLRLLAGGGQAIYVPRSYGKGLTPDNFLDYKRQRFRWALGAVQILRRHGAWLRGAQPSSLTPGQRYHFVAGWLPWLAEGVGVGLAVFAVVWSTLMLLFPLRVDPPLAALSLVPVGMLAARLAKHGHLYRSRVGASWRQVLGAGLAGLALMPAVGVAVLAGLAGLRRDFLRTPKLARRHSLVGALCAAGGEAAMVLALLSAAVAVGNGYPPGGADVTAWRLMLLVMSVPFVCALCLSLLSVGATVQGIPYAPAPAVARGSRER